MGIDLFSGALRSLHRRIVRLLLKSRSPRYRLSVHASFCKARYNLYTIHTCIILGERDPHSLPKCVNVGLSRKLASFLTSHSSGIFWCGNEFSLLPCSHPWMWSTHLNSVYMYIDEDIECKVNEYVCLHFLIHRTNLDITFRMSRARHGKSKSDIITIPNSINSRIEVFAMLSIRSGYEFECRIINGIFPLDMTL